MSFPYLKKALNTVVLLGACVAAGSVFAHAHLKSETPAADSTVSAPSELRLVFSEGVEAALTKVELSSGGTPVAASIASDPADKKILVVTPAAPLKAGNYKVEWHAVSVDTHKSEGNYDFKVGN
ncbi:copper homeostasis periplasmic binding protein CopC [Pseudomonas gingeri]|uniref:Copper resistance protein C n=1 Tax=Pseudomonas gingeri TaxID=117681 RepID=A0A7Y7Y8N7_9PSED|nr:copper homeostasis periplasmic binding protein CopC [Pseudomonas gingeri]NVZ99936.1 copper homeostasis periplasmic binding protein CopC [Pseudomonas gingeri]NWA16776.1 copper homeostasis periplasmic binding protein CopC [Pseudomonas gingeri]NWA53838.1 copper homeostasis periplasmic binding protein CopC [Pseudomonas gingeri]NWA94070.1 copper homeostasis periplasmic binding protein CopC [Pseudomonas gingeri]NWB02030.1 copper homeostasis periplasmic binding protein CopC [Pseudomonas gingeri]